MPHPQSCGIGDLFTSTDEKNYSPSSHAPLGVVHGTSAVGSRVVSIKVTHQGKKHTRSHDFDEKYVSLPLKMPTPAVILMKFAEKASPICISTTL